VERVSPDAGRRQRVAAVSAGARNRRADRRPSVVRIIDVGEIEVAGNDGRAGAAISDTAALDHASRRGTADDGGVVGAMDGDGDDLRSAVDREDRKRIAQYLPAFGGLPRA